MREIRRHIALTPFGYAGWQAVAKLPDAAQAATDQLAQEGAPERLDLHHTSRDMTQRRCAPCIALLALTSSAVRNWSDPQRKLSNLMLLIAVGEAQRRGSQTPSALERLRRLGQRYLALFPKPVRKFIGVELELALLTGVLVTIVLLLALAFDLVHR